jgi:hypothetical protein
VELTSGGTRQLASISNVRSCCTSSGLRKRRTGLGQPTHFVCSLLPLAVGRQLGNWLSMRAEHFSRLRQATCAPSDVPAPVNQVCRDGDSRKNLSPIECVFPPKTFSQECPSRCNRQIALSASSPHGIYIWPTGTVAFGARRTQVRVGITSMQRPRSALPWIRQIRTSVYAGAASEVGVLKSTDGGSSFTPKNHGMLGAFASRTGSVQIDPKNPRLLYVGTDGTGVFKSTDGAESWFRINSGLDDLSVFGLAMAPGSPNNILYSATFSSVYKKAVTSK